MPIKYLAIDPIGGAHTRTSDRIYTHTIVAKLSHKHALLNASKTVPYHTFEELSSRIALANLPWEKIYYSKILGDCTTEEDYLKLIIYQQEEQVFKYHQMGLYDQYCNHGWCGRPDLAEKRLRSFQKEAYDDIKILPARVV